ncbi:fdrA domain protein [Clostridium sp. MCC353]|uniref:fdrA domain protein n=1 Tax=Clostridium sp. MCC353 TaxID=2592646 RepID=UPI001C030EFD|nr:fdrA domain protein [Clostridium sp. MCC353]MBT9776769.1 fdrA domain protein [Clostridium sp. MCC353]
MREKPITQEKEMEVINLGLPGFYESVRSQQVPCVHVDWRPPAGGNLRLIEILDRLAER